MKEYVLVVEDNICIRQQLIDIINDIKPELQVLSTGYVNEAMEYVRQYDIVAFFFDIQLHNESGLDLAKEVRKIKRYEFTPMVFITGMPTKELEAYRHIHCYDYILKPFDEEKIRSLFSKLLINYNELVRKPEDRLTLQFKTHVQYVHVDKIIYVESVKRKIFIVTEKEKIPYIRCPLNKLVNQLPSYFVRSHQSILINKHKIEKVDYSNYSLATFNGDTLPIGRTYYKSLKEVLDDVS